MASKATTGKVIKLSRELTSHLDTLRTEREGYDSLLRRHFGLPTRKGYDQSLKTYYVIDTPDALIIRRKLSEARGDAILLAVKRGQKFAHKEKKDAVVSVRELP